MNIAKYFFYKNRIFLKILYFDPRRMVWDEIAFAKASKFSGRELTSIFLDDLIKIR